MIVKPLQQTDADGNCIAEPRPAMPRVADMCEDDKPRERARKYGCSVLSVPDLWALILRTGSVGYPITEVCRDIMKASNGKLKMLERRTRQELMEVKGLGMMKAIQVEAVMELIRRYNAETPAELPEVRCSRDIYNVISPRIAHLDHEEVWVVIMDRRHRVVKLLQASKGGWASSLFDIKIIIKEALLENAAAIALCHNHPSGNMKPSPQDDAITRKCAEACKIMEIAMLDHIIVSPDNYYSYNDLGQL
ncbi:MAG: DNA repair protein RadC [Prevotella sp.]|nr:DNA repair protein RadC [Prevotella sp.]MCM1074799.1 DNA repair protein RadC [Ruminococcus sp.]